MLYTATIKINICDVKIESRQSDFEFKIELNEKDMLLAVPNPKYESILSYYPHLRVFKMDEFQTKAVLPIHVILAASDFTKIKIKEAPRIMKIGGSHSRINKIEMDNYKPRERK